MRTSVITTGVCPSGANCCNVPVTLNSKQLTSRNKGPMRLRVEELLQTNNQKPLCF